MAETTTQTRFPSRAVRAMRSATRSSLGTSATELPPYFWTTISMAVRAIRYEFTSFNPQKRHSPQRHRDTETQRHEEKRAANFHGAAEPARRPPTPGFKPGLALFTPPNGACCVVPSDFFPVAL